MLHRMDTIQLRNFALPRRRPVTLQDTDKNYYGDGIADAKRLSQQRVMRRSCELFYRMNKKIVEYIHIKK